MNEQNVNNAFSAVIDALVQSVDEEHKQKYLENAEKYKDIDLNKFSNWTLYKYDSKIMDEQFVKQFFLAKGALPDNVSKIAFVYMNFDFIEHNVEKMVDLGHGCCVDKTHYLMRCYVNFLVDLAGVEFADRNDYEHKYWEPDFGTFEQWFHFIESLEYLYYGYTEKYLENLNILLREKEKVEIAIEEQSKKAKDFLPRYIDFIEQNKDSFTEEEYERCSNKHYRLSIVYGIIPNINDDISDDELIKQLKEYYKKKFAK